MFRTLIPLLLMATACALPRGPVAAAELADEDAEGDAIEETVNGTSEPTERCAAAERYRRLGFLSLKALDFKSARVAFRKALALDPGNSGVFYQLELMERADQGGLQIGTAEGNSYRQSRTLAATCPRPERQAHASSTQDPAPVAELDGQIVTQAGDASANKLSHSLIHQTVVTAKDALTECYRRALGARRNPASDLERELSVRFTVAPSGKIASAITEKSVGNDEVDHCVERAISALVFPKIGGTGEIAVTYPISFR